MKKKTYTKPQVQAILLRGPLVMLEGSNTVNTYKSGGSINIGDSDEDEPATP